MRTNFFDKTPKPYVHLGDQSPCLTLKTTLARNCKRKLLLQDFPHVHDAINTLIKTFIFHISQVFLIILTCVFR